MESCKMAEDSRIPPPVVWAQRQDKLFITFNVEDCKDPVIKLEEQKLTFKGKGGTENRNFEVTIEFFKEINPAESKFVILPRNIPMMIKKKEEGTYWPRMLKEAKKQHWLKTDFNKWRDEDDSDFEDTDDMKLEDMMKQMGNFNAENAETPNDEEDSDDEELPDLE